MQPTETLPTETLRYETLRHPARTLDPARAEALRAQILTLNLRLSDAPAFRANWQARIGGFFDGLEWLELAWCGDRLVGHHGTRRFALGRAEAFYVDNFTVDPAWQGRGIGRTLTGRWSQRLALRSLGRTVFLLARTQSPVIGAETAAAVGAKHAYPRFVGPADPALARVAERVVDALWPGKAFDPQTGVLQAAYGGRFLDVAPTRHAAVAAYFARHVDLDRGDALVQVVRACPGSWARMLRYFVGHSLRRLVARARLSPTHA